MDEEMHNSGVAGYLAENERLKLENWKLRVEIARIQAKYDLLTGTKPYDPPKSQETERQITRVIIERIIAVLDYAAETFERCAEYHANLSEPDQAKISTNNMMARSCREALAPMLVESFLPQHVPMHLASLMGSMTERQAIISAVLNNMANTRVDSQDRIVALQVLNFIRADCARRDTERLREVSGPWG